MPSSTRKQARVMSARAHGWHPTGSAAGIPVSVAKEFHAADAGHKYGGKHKGTAGPKVAAKFKKQYHQEAGTPYRGYGGGISKGKAADMPVHNPPDVALWSTEFRHPPHMRDAVERDWEHRGGYRSGDPDHPQVFPHNQTRHGDGYMRHVARMAYPSGVSTHRHMQGTAGGHQIGGHSPRHGAHTFRGMRTRTGK